METKKQHKSKSQPRAPRGPYPRSTRVEKSIKFNLKINPNVPIYARRNLKHKESTQLKKLNFGHEETTVRSSHRSCKKTTGRTKGATKGAKAGPIEKKAKPKMAGQVRAIPSVIKDPPPEQLKVKPFSFKYQSNLVNKGKSKNQRIVPVGQSLMFMGERSPGQFSTASCLPELSCMSKWQIELKYQNIFVKRSNQFQGDSKFDGIISERLKYKMKRMNNRLFHSQTQKKLLKKKYEKRKRVGKGYSYIVPSPVVGKAEYHSGEVSEANGGVEIGRKLIIHDRRKHILGIGENRDKRKRDFDNENAYIRKRRKKSSSRIHLDDNAALHKDEIVNIGKVVEKKSWSQAVEGLQLVGKGLIEVSKELQDSDSSVKGEDQSKAETSLLLQKDEILGADDDPMPSKKEILNQTTEMADSKFKHLLRIWEAHTQEKTAPRRKTTKMTSKNTETDFEEDIEMRRSRMRRVKKGMKMTKFSSEMSSEADLNDLRSRTRSKEFSKKNKKFKKVRKDMGRSYSRMATKLSNKSRISKSSFISKQKEQSKLRLPTFDRKMSSKLANHQINIKLDNGKLVPEDYYLTRSKMPKSEIFYCKKPKKNNDRKNRSTHVENSMHTAINGPPPPVQLNRSRHQKFEGSAPKFNQEKSQKSGVIGYHKHSNQVEIRQNGGENSAVVFNNKSKILKSLNSKNYKNKYLFSFQDYDKPPDYLDELRQKRLKFLKKLSHKNFRNVKFESVAKGGKSHPILDALNSKGEALPPEVVVDENGEEIRYNRYNGSPHDLLGGTLLDAEDGFGLEEYLEMKM